MEQMCVMECSEDESVDENERDEEWENEDQNQMDFEQESVDEVLEDAASMERAMEKPNSELSELIQSNEIKKQKYEEILKNQLQNIIELQGACEKVACTLDQLPMLKEQNSLNFNQVRGEMQGIKEKQCKLNELIELTVTIYDNNMAFVYSAKEDFVEQQRMNDERYTVFEMDVQEFPKMSDEVYSRAEKSLKKKREYCWLLNNYLADVAKCEDTSKELNVKTESAFMAASNLNEKLLESESKLELHRRSAEKLSGDLQRDENEFVKEINDISKREMDCTVKLLAVKEQVDEVNRQLQNKLKKNIQTQNDIATAQQKMGTLQKEKQEKTLNRTNLRSHLEELTNQERTLTESLVGLTRCKQMVVLLEEEVKSLEGELSQQQLKSEELAKQCDNIAKQMAEINNRETTIKITALENEYAKISPDVSSLRNNVIKRRAELDAFQKKTSEEINKVQSEIDQMTKEKFEYHRIFDEYCNQFVTLQHHKEKNSTILKEKYSLITQKEECMHSINEDLEECKVEFNDLIEQKQKALELKNQVCQCEHELNKGSKELVHMNENSNKEFSKMNEINNKQTEEALKEIENQKQEYLSALEEKTKEISALEDEFKELQLSSVSSKNMLKDATKQAELFTCEQSLLSTFAKWVFEEATPSVPTAETWVTSTSEGDYKTAGTVIESENDFDVREINTIRRYIKN